MFPTSAGKVFLLGTDRIAVPGNTWATPAGMKYIHDEWKQGNAGKSGVV